MRLPLTEDSVSTQLHHFVFTEQRNKQEPEMLHNQKNVFHSNVAVWFFTLFMCGDGGIRTRDLQRDKLASYAN